MRPKPMALIVLAGLTAPATTWAGEFRVRELSIDAGLAPAKVSGAELTAELAGRWPEVALSGTTSAVGVGLSTVVGWERLGLALSWRSLEVTSSQRLYPHTASVTLSASQVGVGVALTPLRAAQASISLIGGVRYVLPTAVATLDGWAVAVDVEPSSGWYAEARARWEIDPDLLNLSIFAGVDNGRGAGDLDVNWGGSYGGIGLGVVF